MKKIIWFWNLIHYKLYVLQTTAHSLFYLVNPFVWVTRIPIVRDFYRKKGISDIGGEINSVFENPETGFNNIWAGGIASGLLIFLEAGLFNLIQIYLGRILYGVMFENYYYLILFILLGITPPSLFNYFTLFKNNKYLEFFKEFEQMPKNKKRFYGWVSFLFVFFVCAFLTGSFYGLVHFFKAQ